MGGNIVARPVIRGVGSDGGGGATGAPTPAPAIAGTSNRPSFPSSSEDRIRNRNSQMPPAEVSSQTRIGPTSPGPDPPRSAGGSPLPADPPAAATGRRVGLGDGVDDDSMLATGLRAGSDALGLGANETNASVGAGDWLASGIGRVGALGLGVLFAGFSVGFGVGVGVGSGVAF